jgi:hypothetical protein
MRTLKVEEMNKSALEVKVQEGEEVARTREQEIARLNKKIDELQGDLQRKTFNDQKIASLGTSRRGSSLREKVKKIEVYDSELK